MRSGGLLTIVTITGIILLLIGAVSKLQFEETSRAVSSRG
jgi:hypothetical protein